ncbi:hypothetical protein BHE74_00037741 [Ensete ventricosum]|nr:hypothetical protein BHE74_00037741 [Ensete ventricosum]
MRRYDQELLRALLCCMTQQEEDLWIQGVNIVVPQRRVFVCASELVLDKSLSHQHMRAVYHRGRSPTSVRNEVDSEEHHSAVEADLPFAKEEMKMQGNG